MKRVDQYSDCLPLLDRHNCDPRLAARPATRDSGVVLAVILSSISPVASLARHCHVLGSKCTNG